MSQDREEAQMRALFGEAPTPPMGDETFVRSVMARVETEKATKSSQRTIASMGAAAFLAAMLWPVRDPIAVALAGAFETAALETPSIGLSAGATALLVAAVASLAAWAYAERG